MTPQRRIISVLEACTRSRDAVEELAIEVVRLAAWLEYIGNEVRGASHLTQKALAGDEPPGEPR